MTPGRRTPRREDCVVKVRRTIRLKASLDVDVTTVGDVVLEFWVADRASDFISNFLNVNRHLTKRSELFVAITVDDDAIVAFVDEILASFSAFEASIASSKARDIGPWFSAFVAQS